MTNSVSLDCTIQSAPLFTLENDMDDKKSQSLFTEKMGF